MPARPRRDGVIIVDASVVLFDLDGVLADSTTSIQKAWATWAHSAGVAWEALSPHIPGRKAVDTVRLAVPAADERWVASAAAAVNQLQVDDFGDVATYPGMSEFYQSLPASCTAVVTSAPRALALARLRRRELPGPGVLVAAEDVAAGKPHPEGWIQAIRAHDATASACLAIEDAPVGITSAAAAGLPVIALATTHHASQLHEADWIVDDGHRLMVTTLGAAGPRVAIHPAEGDGAAGP